MKELTVPPEFNGARLDIFLQAHFLDFSRAWIQKQIKSGRALANGKKILVGKKLKTGDVVSFEPELPPEISMEPDNSLDQKVKVIFENNDFLVVNKPSGISVHPSTSEPKGTLVNWLLARYPNIKSVGDEPASGNIRPGIVHRLDKETSGVMVVAKNQKTFLWLKSQFQNHKVIKKYLVLVNGSPARDSGLVDLNIVRSKSDPTKNTVTKSKQEGRTALTYWKVLRRFPDHTLLEATPQTGRMHQIRVHMKALGLPVAGDKKYGSKKRGSPKHIGRMFLHAEYLSFKAPNSEKFSFHCPLPPELETILRNIPFVLK